MIHTAICHAVATLLVSVAASGAVAGEVMDKMMRMQHMHDELVSGVKGHTTTDPTTMLKGLRERQFDDVNAIVRNVGN